MALTEIQTSELQRRLQEEKEKVEALKKDSERFAPLEKELNWIPILLADVENAKAETEQVNTVAVESAKKFSDL